MDILTEIEKQNIADAYDKMKRDDFLTAISQYIESTIEVVRQEEQLEALKAKASELLKSQKTKPGPKVRSKEEVEA